MPDRSTQPLSRPARRHDRRGEYDIADIYEARLLAHGLRSEDFLALRSSTDVPTFPDVTPIRFGRGATSSELAPIASVAVALPLDAGEPSVTAERQDLESS